MADLEEDKKLNWMYKGPNSMVNREEYLLGRKVDKTLEQLDAEEKDKIPALPVPKNHVEHECIPPSIRDFNKIVQAEQVDLSAKLQEDPLVAIKKREEEARRQFLQNPVQLKKLQKALEAQAARKSKHRHRDGSSDDELDSDLDDKIEQKLALLKNSKAPLTSLPKKPMKSKQSSLDTILMHKFNQFKDKLTEDDLREILAKDSDSEKKCKKKKKLKEKIKKKKDKKCKSKKKKLKKKYSSTSSETSSESSEDERKSRKKKKVIKRKHRKHSSSSSSSDTTDSDSSSDEKAKKISKKERRRSIERHDERRYKRNRSRSRSISQSKRPSTSKKTKREDSSEEDQRRRVGKNSDKPPKIYIKPQYDSDGNELPAKSQAWGLVKSDGTKIEVKSKSKHEIKKEKKTVEEAPKPVQKNKAKKLTEEEKERLRREMMQNAQWRDKERTENVKRYREKDKNEETNHKEGYKNDFVHRELMKSANNSTVEGRIKSNLNNIQRSSKHMDSHFSRR